MPIPPGSSHSFGFAAFFSRPGVSTYTTWATIVARARKIELQPSFVAEMFTGTPGRFVDLGETISGFRRLRDGEFDDVPETAFYMVGTIDEALEKAARMAN